VRESEIPSAALAIEDPSEMSSGVPKYGSPDVLVEAFENANVDCVA
jgi:hypothetical protein